MSGLALIMKAKGFSNSRKRYNKNKNIRKIKKNINIIEIVFVDLFIKILN